MLTCVNAQNAYRENPETTRLIQVGNAAFPVRLHPRAAVALRQILMDLRCGSEIIPVSGYRSFQEQERLYQDSLRENGQAFTVQYVAMPGHSEHQTGLAVDMALNGPNIDPIRPAFPYRGVCQAFRERAVLYGFIERYPKGKEEMTGIAHEPWHFRYVGLPHSVFMQRLNLTLEEYVADAALKHCAAVRNLLS